MSTPYTPSSPSWKDTIDVYADGDPASGNQMAAPLKDLQDNIYVHRNLEKINSASGSHGLRYYMDQLEHYDEEDEEWKEIDTGSSKSLVIITTDNSDYFNQNVILHQDILTFTGKFGAPVDGVATAQVKVAYTGIYYAECAEETFGRVVVSSVGGVYYLDDTIQIYGYKIAKNDSNPNTRVTLTDDCAGFTPMSMDLTTGDVNSYGSFENSWILQKFRPVMLNPNGTVAYELDHDDQTLKLDGTASDISDSTKLMNAMIGVKPIYTYRYEDENYKYCKLANKAVNAHYVAWCNIADDGETILEETYTNMFEGSNIGSKVRSLAGQTPMNNVAGDTEISYAKANGSGWDLSDWAFFKLWEDMMYLLGRSTDVQGKWGNGHYTGGTSASSLLQTGTTKQKGAFYGTSGNVAMKFLWKENAYGDRCDRIQGCINDSGTIKVKMHPPYNTTAEGYENTGVTPGGTSGGYISDGVMTQYGFIPKTASGSDSTYWPDGLWFNNSQRDFALVGGACYVGLRVGASCVNVADLLSSANWSIGPSLSYRRPVAA